MDADASDARTAVDRCEDLLTQWRAERNSPSFEPVDWLTSLTELLEAEMNIFFSTDPDPFDDRHPLRTDSSCDLGQVLRLLSAHESFIERLTFIYLVGSTDPADRTVVAAARLLCAMRLGVTLSFTLDEEVPIVVKRLMEYTRLLQSEVAAATPSRRELGMNNLLGSFHLHPLTTEMKIRLSISYLLPIAEYQDIMPFMYNGGVLNTIYTFLSPAIAERDIRLTFEALRLLGNLMCHRCVYMEFVEKEGLQAVLRVPRPSVAATAVSIVLYYTAYFDDAMERVCQLPRDVLVEMIKYALWLVECSHPSARCYSLFFVNLVLCYGITFELFESQNGLVYLYNAICVLPLRLTEDHPPALKDTTSWHVVRASLCAIRRFLEVSLLLWIDTIDPTLANLFDEPPRAVAAAGHRSIVYSSEQLSRLVSLVIARVRPDTVWAPTKQLKDCGAITVLYRIIARNVYAHNSWPCRNECTRLAVDIFNLMSITYDLADEIATSDAYCFPSGMHSGGSGGGFHGATSPPLFHGHPSGTDSPHSGAGSTDITVHLPSPSGGGTNTGSGRSERRGLLNQLLELAEQIGAGGGWESDGRRASRHNRRGLTHNPGGSDGSSNTAGGPRSGAAGGSGGAVLDSDGNEIGGSEEQMNDTSTDERVNGLHMLFSISREEDGWDVAVHKSILAFVCTLVYRPIVSREHPDNPIPATQVIGHYVSSSAPLRTGSPPPSPALGLPCPMASPSGSQARLAIAHGSPPPPFKTPNRLASSNLIRTGRKRRLDEQSTLQPLFLSSADPASIGGSLWSPIASAQRCTSPNPGLPNPFSESSMPSPMGRNRGTRLLYRQAQLWNTVRRHHGIMALLFHLETKQPISDADSVRTLACRGLVGLARSEEVRSMLAKMPLFTKALLQLLMKEPILPDRLTEHAEFCRYATMLIRLVVGTLSDGVLPGDMSLERVRRAEIVAKTRIQWDQDELLELIYRHLQNKGLHNAAETLQQEARLKLAQPAPSQLPLYDDFNRPPGETPPYQPTPGFVSTEPHPCSTPQQLSIDPEGGECSKVVPVDAPERTDQSTGPNGDNAATAESPAPHLQSNLRLIKVRPTPTTTTQTPKAYRDRFERPSIPNLYLKPVSKQPPPEMTLSKVVESFLLHQHAQCPHPVSVCPKFSLYHPHRCPGPRANRQTNCCQRLLARDTLYSSLRLRPSRREDRHFLHRRFQPTTVIREAEDDLLTACCFSLTDDGLFLGATSGAIAWVNVEEDGLPVELFHVQTSSIRRLAHTRDGERLLVCSEWGEPATVVAQLRPAQGSGTTNTSPWEAVAEDFVFQVSEARYAEFSNTGSQDRLVATYGKMAKVFDLSTGARVADLYSAAKQSGYVLNKATFSPFDQLVLNDGVVWDLRCVGTSIYSPNAPLQPGSLYRPVHKIDKLQDLVSGVFHPNGMEIIVGSAVWDVRTWRLLHTVQALDRLEIQFNATKDVIYAGNFGWDEEEYAELGNKRMVMQNMFRTLDALDYSLISSVDVRHRIEQLALDTTGQSLALVEKVGENSSNEPITQCRIYMVGRKRGEREPDNEEEEGHEDDDDDDDEDDDDDDEDDDDDLMNAETVDELADILDGSSGNDDNSNMSSTSDGSDGSDDDSDSDEGSSDMSDMSDMSSDPSEWTVSTRSSRERMRRRRSSRLRIQRHRVTRTTTGRTVTTTTPTPTAPIVEQSAVTDEQTSEIAEGVEVEQEAGEGGRNSSSDVSMGEEEEASDLFTEDD